MTGAKEIRAALARQLQEVLVETQVSAHMLSDPTPPGAHVYPARVDFDQAFGRGLDVEEYAVEVFVAEVSDIGSQDVLDDYLEPDGPLSVKAAIEADRTLGGLVDDLHCYSQSGYRRYLRDSGLTPVLGAQWLVRVWKS